MCLAAVVMSHYSRTKPSNYTLVHLSVYTCLETCSRPPPLRYFLLVASVAPYLPGVGRDGPRAVVVVVSVQEEGVQEPSIWKGHEVGFQDHDLFPAIVLAVGDQHAVILQGVVAVLVQLVVA